MYRTVNLVDRQLEVYHQPIADVNAKYGFCYRLSEIYQPGQIVRPLAMGETVVAVSDVLP